MKGSTHFILLSILVLLHACHGSFKIDFKLLKLPRFGHPLNFEILFDSPSSSSATATSPNNNSPFLSSSSSSVENAYRNGRSATRSAFVSLGRKPSITFRDYGLPAPAPPQVFNNEASVKNKGNSRSSRNNDDLGPSMYQNDFGNEYPTYTDEEMMTQVKSLDRELDLNMNKTRQTTSTSAPLIPSSSPEDFVRPANISIAGSSLFPDLSILKQLFQWTGQSAKSFALCHACKVGIGLFMMRARGSSSQESLMQTAIFGCTFFKIAPEEMCQGLVTRFGPVLLYIVNERSELSADMFCGVILQYVGCVTKERMSDWDVLTTQNLYTSSREKKDTGSFSENSTKSIQLQRHNSRYPINQVPPKIPKDAPLMKILHLTDVHVDPHYTPGANANCDKEMCCRPEDVIRLGDINNVGAGYYGDYRKCDLPYRSFENALAHISRTHPDIELMYLTGDIVPHNVWSTDPDENMEIISNCSSLIHKYFPNTIVMPVLGNHETHPVNLFSPYNIPPKFSTDWVYKATAKAWSPWLPEGALKTFLFAGFYDRVISPKFRIIVLNTNLCYTYNFWIMYDDRDPSGQLRWLATELQKSEDIGQKVHILGHVPPGQEDCWSTWSKNFYNIITRYSTTVTAQFYGHTHYDEFKLFYHPIEKGRPISPMWIGASLTPYTNLNPGYKIFTVDGKRGDDSTWQVVDHETWIYDLGKANQNPGKGPEWYRLYKATEACGIPDVLPSSLNKFVHRMSSNITDFNNYYWNYHKAAIHTDKQRRACDSICRKRILCNIVTPYQNQQADCMLLQSEVDGVILPMRLFENKRPGADFRVVNGVYNNTSNKDDPSSISQLQSSPIQNTTTSPSLFDRIFGPS